MIGVGSKGAAPKLGNLRAAPSPRRSEQGGWAGIDLAALDPDVETPYWIAISLVPGVGPVGFARLLRRFGSAQAAWGAGAALLGSLPRVPDDAAPALARLQREGVAHVASRVVSATRRSGGFAITALDAAYPPALLAADPRPPVLVPGPGTRPRFRGRAWRSSTRRAAAMGRSVAADIAEELARAGVTIVSGLLLGIDAQAHVSAVEAGGLSVAVLPSPLDRIYPPRHRELAARLVATGGALISELAPGHSPGKPDFARRNRIIAGLAEP